ncbi:carbohydrate-binding module family 18 protein [Diplodia corticola]|uniref:Carbohydrate-binding module family 18 protein n=1 Tax=Diplodia corticola TaxID=236234 RepID=A0A1J9RT14_9PEZI|nr:carbohydrate-binding module family 18 protein [Diplodia corticola]OJD31012.1 carbohydrate-binding module family 18 protein [Diplodia corticola]
MASLTPFRLAVGAALLLAKVCYGQDASPSPSATDDSDNDSDSEVASPSSSAFAYPPGSYQIGSATYYVACEAANTGSGLSPANIADIAASIDDYGACMAFCNTLGDECGIAMWDVYSNTPCVLLTSFETIATSPLGRCYAAKSPNFMSGSSSMTAAPSSSSYPTPYPWSKTRAYPPPGGDQYGYGPPPGSPPAQGMNVMSPSSPFGAPMNNPMAPASSPSSSPQQQQQQQQQAAAPLPNTNLRRPASTPVSPALPLQPARASSRPSNRSRPFASAFAPSPASSSRAAPSFSDIDPFGTDAPYPLQTLRADSRCGMEWGNIPYTSCPIGDRVYGPCCSRFGYCGFGRAYCELGCQPKYGLCAGADF